MNSLRGGEGKKKTCLRYGPRGSSLCVQEECSFFNFNRGAPLLAVQEEGREEDYIFGTEGAFCYLYTFKWEYPPKPRPDKAHVLARKGEVM